MTRLYSNDLRERVVAAVLEGTLTPSAGAICPNPSYGLNFSRPGLASCFFACTEPSAKLAT